MQISCQHPFQPANILQRLEMKTHHHQNFMFSHFPLIPPFCPPFFYNFIFHSIPAPPLFVAASVSTFICLLILTDPPPWRPPSPLNEESHGGSGTASGASHSGLSKRASQVTIGLPSPPNYSVALLLPHGSTKEQSSRMQNSGGGHQGSHQGGLPKPSAPPPDSL